MMEFFHDANFLIDVFLEEGFFLEVSFADNFDGIEFILFWVNRDVLFRARTTYPKAPLPMDLMIS